MGLEREENEESSLPQLMNIGLASLLSPCPVPLEKVNSALGNDSLVHIGGVLVIRDALRQVTFLRSVRKPRREVGRGGAI